MPLQYLLGYNCKLGQFTALVLLNNLGNAHIIITEHRGYGG